MLNRILNNAETIAIGGHIRPDGDCVGSCMGLYHYIRDNYKDKKVDVYLEELPDKFCFLKSTEVIRHKIPKDKVYDLFISLDCGDKERLGFSVPPVNWYTSSWMRIRFLLRRQRLFILGSYMIPACFSILPRRRPHSGWRQSFWRRA